MKLHLRWVAGELRGGRSHLAPLAVCLAGSTLLVCCVVSWRGSVTSALEGEGRRLLGGDVAVTSRSPFSDTLQRRLSRWPQARTTELFTVVTSNRDTLFCKLKAVSPDYPLYGAVPLEGGGALQPALRRGLVVERRVLERLGLRLGDRVRVGDSLLPVSAVALSEPDRPLGMFGIAPRLFLAEKKLPATGLLRPGSYRENKVMLKLAPAIDSAQVAGELRELAVADQEQVDCWDRLPGPLRRMVSNFLLFLDLLAGFAVCLCAFGTSMATQAWLRARASSVAASRSLGATPDWISMHLGATLFCAAAGAVAAGLVGAASLVPLTGTWLAPLLPVAVQARLSASAALAGTVVAVWCCALAAAWSGSGMRRQAPAAALRGEAPRPRRLTRWSLALAALATLWGALRLSSGSSSRAAGWTLGLLLLLGLVRLAVGLALRLTRGWKPGNLAVRIAWTRFQWHGSSTAGVAWSLTCTLLVLGLFAQSARALQEGWINTLPADAPNLWCGEIDPARAARFLELVPAARGHLYPALRVRLESVDGEPIDRSRPRLPGDEDGRREFRAGQGGALDADERLVSGGEVFSGADPNEVSITEEVARQTGLRVGSRAVFQLQGLPLEVRVNSVRHIVRDNFRPTFDCLFPDDLVRDAPRMLFAMCRLPEAEIGPLQARLARALPAVTSLDLSFTLRQVGGKLKELTTLLQFFGLAGWLAGLSTLWSSAVATRPETLRNVALWKAVGASPAFVWRCLAAESCLLGGFCSLLAFGLSGAATAALCAWQFEVPYPMMPATWLLLLLLPAVSVALVGAWLARPALNIRPASALRHDA